LIGLALAGWHVLALRFVDRTGKGLRTSPRDALVAAATGPEQRGLAFGLHRALDSAGAALGQLIATALLLAFAGNLRLVFIVSLVPGVIAMWILIARVRDERLPASPEPLPTSARTDCSSPLAGGLPSGPFRLYLVAVILFTLGNSTDVFLILRAQNLGVPLALVPSLWLVLSLVRAGAALPGGRLSDRIGRRPAILIGWSVYALSYAGFAFAREPWHVWALFALYGLHYGLVEGPERALVGDLVPCEQRGYAYGWFHLCVGMGALPASLLFGLIWQATGAGPAFGFGALMSGLAALMLLIVKAGNRYE
jgi:MFS family permease